MEGKKIECKSIYGEEITGRVLLVFTDAILSAGNEYVAVTYMSVQTESGKVYTVRPRDVYKVIFENKACFFQKYLVPLYRTLAKVVRVK